jgi:hypothetical protein
MRGGLEEPLQVAPSCEDLDVICMKDSAVSTKEMK